MAVLHHAQSGSVSLVKTSYTLAEIRKNDIVLTSPLVSGEHGCFAYKGDSWIMEDKVVYKDVASTNGLIYNNASIISRTISDGDFIRIDDGVETISEGVLFVLSSADSDNKWYAVPLSGKQELTIGREESCDINANALIIYPVNQDVNGVHVPWKMVLGPG